MRVDKFYIAQVLKDVCNALSGISENISADNRKTTSQKQMKDFIVVSLPTNIPSSKVFQNTTLRIDIAARNIHNGLEDTERLQKMLDNVMSKFPLSYKRFSAFRPTLVLKGDDGIGFSHWLINSVLTINMTDSYKYNN